MPLGNNHGDKRPTGGILDHPQSGRYRLGRSTSKKPSNELLNAGHRYDV